MLTLRDDLTFSEVIGLKQALGMDLNCTSLPAEVPEGVAAQPAAVSLARAVLEGEPEIRKAWARPILQAFFDLVEAPLKRMRVPAAGDDPLCVVTPRGILTSGPGGRLTSGRRGLQSLLGSEEGLSGGEGFPPSSAEGPLAPRIIDPAGGEEGETPPAAIKQTEGGWTIDPPLELRQTGVHGGFALACRALAIDPLSFLKGAEPDVEAPSVDAVELLLEATCTNASSVELEAPPAPVIERIASKMFASFCELHVPTTNSFARTIDEVPSDG